MPARGTSPTAEDGNQPSPSEACDNTMEDASDARNGIASGGDNGDGLELELTDSTAKRLDGSSFNDTATPNTAASTEAQRTKTHADEGNQQSAVNNVNSADDTTRNYGGEIAGPESSERATSRSQHAAAFNLGNSILRTPAGPGNPNLLRIQASQRAIRERLLAARKAKEAVSHESSTGGGSGRQATSNEGGDMDDEEAEHRRLVAAWKKKKKDFERRLKEGVSSADEELEYLRDQHEEEVRVRRYKECKQRVAEERRRHAESDRGALFVPEERGIVEDALTADGTDNAENDSDDDMYHIVKTSRKTASNGKRRKRSVDGVDLGDDEHNLAALLEPTVKRKRSKKSTGDDTSSKDGTRTPGRPKASKASKPKAKAGKKAGSQGHQLANLASLYTSDVIRDAGQNHTLGDQPTFSSTKRNEAMKQLIATLPKEQRKINQVDKNYVQSALGDFIGRRTIKQIPDTGHGESGFQVKGMKSYLKPFQLLGSAFMRRRELGDDAPYGGLDADQMGLGKSVMMLANIADALAYRQKDENVATLIVVPAALIEQWKGEIQRHLDLSKLGPTPSKPAKILIYKRGGVLSTDAGSLISGHEFVLTTYHEVLYSYPRCKELPAFEDAEHRRRWLAQYVKDNKGPLHQIQWARIVLDEAQAIKNRKSSTSLACRQLQGRCRWALSGTPIPNFTNELYAYFRFLRVPSTGDYNVFCKNFIGKNDPDKHDRLQVFLSKILLRRTHQDRLFNQPLVKLPKPSSEVHYVEFNDFERSVYEIVRRRMIERINHFAAENELEKNYRNVLVMLLRLRQLTGHVLAIESTMRDLFELEDHERLKELAEEQADPRLAPVRIAQIAQLRRVLAKQHGDDDDDDGATRVPRRCDSATPHDMELMDLTPDDGTVLDVDDLALPLRGNGTESSPPKPHNEPKVKKINTGRSHGVNYDFRHYLKSLREGKQFDELQRRQVCAVCDQQPEEPWITSCFHLMCLECLTVVQQEAARLDRDRARCPECGDKFHTADPLVDWHLESRASDMSDEGFSSPEEDGDGDDSSGRKKSKRRRKKNKLPDWINMSDHHLLPSSKTMAIKAQVLNWLEKDPGQKIIIYTQFINMIRILARICSHEGWGYEEYYGELPHDARNKAIQKFKDKPETVILLASLKCGGVGLNLTMASRVIVVDPWWNKSVEEQAFCRVFRIGQEYETYMTRFAVKNTVDEAMINMQDKKQAEIDDVMNDGRGRRTRQLPVKELMRLFGETRDDENGRPFILVQNNPPEPYAVGEEDEDTLGEEE